MRCASCRRELGRPRPENRRGDNFYCDACLGHIPFQARWHRAPQLGWSIQDYYDNDREPPGVVPWAARKGD